MIKSSRKEYVMWTCFKFWLMKNIFRKLWVNESLIMPCLQIYRELLSLGTFLRVHSKLNGFSYLSWRNAYPNLKTKIFLWTKLLENLLLTKNLISVVAALNHSFLRCSNVRKKVALGTNAFMLIMTILEILSSLQL